MRTITLVTMIVAALSVMTSQAAEGADGASVTVKWLMDPSADAAAEKGTVTIPVVDPASDCASKFHVIGISKWIVQQKGTNDVVDVRSEISISIRKLFEGSSPLPELTFVQSMDELDMRAVISFRDTNAVAKASWTTADLEFTEEFDASAIASPRTWKRIELRCSH
jgi:hypothetical protein